MIDPTTDYEKALALFSKMPGAKPFSLIDPAKDFRNAPKWNPALSNPNIKTGMVSSVVDVKPQRKQWSTNALLGLVNDNQVKTQEELARQQRRVAAQGMVNGLGNVMKSLFSAYGASKGAPISPVKGTSQLDIARMDELWNQQMNLEQRANAEKLQLMLEDVRNNRTTEEYWQRYAQQQQDEQNRDVRNFEQQKTLYGMNETRQKEISDQNFEHNKVLYGIKSTEQQALADQKEAARVAELEKYGKFSPKSASASMTPEEKLQFEAEKAKQKKFFSIGDTDLTEGQYNETLTTIEQLKNDNAVPVLNKKGKNTGEVTYKDPRFKVLDDIDMSTKIGQDKAIRTYYKILNEQTETPTQPGVSAGQPATVPTAGKGKELSFQEFGTRLEQTMSDPVFRQSDKSGHVKQLTGIALRFKSKVPELKTMSDTQIQEVIQAYYDQYYSKK
jgi:hypothetical protein